jgi:hypothetical protein
MFETTEFKDSWSRFHPLMLEEFDRLGVKIFKRFSAIKWASDLKHGLARDVLEGGLRALMTRYRYLIFSYTYAAAAQSIANDEEKNGRRKLQNYWTRSIRDLHFYEFPTRLASFQDDAARFVAALSLYELVLGSKMGLTLKIYYGPLRKRLKDSLQDSDQIGLLTQKDRDVVFKFLDGMNLEKHNPEAHGAMRRFRNEETP